MAAAKRGQTDIVQALLEAGADINAKDKYGKTTALMFAAANGHTDVVELLKKARAKE